MILSFLRVLLLMLIFNITAASAADLGFFTTNQDIGKLSHPGSAVFDPGTKALTISGGGENMWSTNDAFHFVWTRVSGDFQLSAAVEWLSTGGNAHRKACLLVRQDLTPESAYVDIALHGNGLTSLQYRAERGGPTREIQIARQMPELVGLQRQSNMFIALAPPAGNPTAPTKSDLIPTGGATRINFADPVYVGMGVCAHDDRTTETARFAKITLQFGGR